MKKDAVDWVFGPIRFPLCVIERLESKRTKLLLFWLWFIPWVIVVGFPLILLAAPTAILIDASIDIMKGK